MSTANQADGDQAALLAALPPLDKMSLVAIWIETVLYGINVVVYLGAAYVLLVKKKERTKVQRSLFMASTLLFLIATAHVGVSLRQLIEAFTDPDVTSIPRGSVLYFFNQTDHYVFTGQLLYLLGVLIQDLVLIWRLYAVCGRDWRAPLLPLAIEVVNQSTALYTIVKLYQGTALEDPHMRRFGILSWSLHLIINVSVTAAIAGSIWWQGRQTVVLHGHNLYTGIAYTILESGGLFSGATLVLFALYINPSTGSDALVGVSPVTQLATLSPLLIIARVGFGLTHGTSKSLHTTDTSQVSTVRFGGATAYDSVHVDVARTRASARDYPESGDLFAMETIKSREDI